jgi:hypothetical protein
LYKYVASNQPLPTAPPRHFAYSVNGTYVANNMGLSIVIGVDANGGVTLSMPAAGLDDIPLSWMGASYPWTYQFPMPFGHAPCERVAIDAIGGEYVYFDGTNAVSMFLAIPGLQPGVSFIRK